MQFPTQTPPATDAETLTRRAQLYAKINKVIVAMERVAKNGYNEHFKYAYATEADLVDAIRAELAEVNLALLPPRVLDFEMVERPKGNGRIDYIARVMIQYGIADCDTGEVEYTVLIAEGTDTADKAFYKAYAGGTKYFLMKSFLVATGDDPENTAPTLRTHLINALKLARDAQPADKRQPLTKAQVDEMTDAQILALCAQLMEDQ